MKPFEHFKCCDCLNLRERWEDHYNSWFECSHKKEPEDHASKACEHFNPKYSYRDRYRICVLESKVEELENQLNVAIGGK